MADFVKCCDDCAPIMQVREKMGEGDYFGEEPDFYQIVEMHDGLRNDIRVVCTKCYMATGWGPRDFPGAPGAGEDYIAKRWGQLVADKKTKAAMLATLREQFGEAALKQFFKKSL